MRYTFLTVVLTMGMIGGLCMGFHQMHESRLSHRAGWKSQVADVCVDAAYGVLRAEGGGKAQQLAPAGVPRAQAEDTP